MKAVFIEHDIICSQHHVEQVKSSRLRKPTPCFCNRNPTTRSGVLEMLLHVSDKLDDKVFGLYYRNNNTEKCIPNRLGLNPNVSFEKNRQFLKEHLNP